MQLSFLMLRLNERVRQQVEFVLGSWGIEGQAMEEKNSEQEQLFCPKLQGQTSQSIPQSTLECLSPEPDTGRREAQV